MGFAEFKTFGVPFKAHSCYFHYRAIIESKGLLVLNFLCYDKSMSDQVHPLAKEELSKSRGQVHFPPGYNKHSRCPECHSDRLVACLINPSATKEDPDILCLNCGNRW